MFQTLNLYYLCIKNNRDYLQQIIFNVSMNVRNLVAFLARVETTKLFRSKTGFYFNSRSVYLR